MGIIDNSMEINVVLTEHTLGNSCNLDLLYISTVHTIESKICMNTVDKSATDLEGPTFLQFILTTKSKHIFDCAF